MNGPFTRGTERAKNGAHDAIESASGRLQSASDRMAQRAHALVERAGTATSDAADAVVRTRQRVTQAPGQMLEYCRTSVRENPWKSLGIAALTGAALYGVWRFRQSARQIEDY
jgi:ElaB/YqjD/DUF883 family membrane-anchored ribosome-binding protein